MGRQIHSLTLKRETAGQKWGFGLTGGKDVSLTFRVEKVALASPAGAAGLKNMDYLVKVSGQEVFEKRHGDVVNMIKNSPGDTLELEVERGEGNDVVPNFDWICPKEKEAKPDPSLYYQDAMKNGVGGDEPPMFTSMGPARLKMGKYNVPVGLYSDETIMELGSSSNHGFVEPENLAPDACDKAKNRKRFNPKKSSVLEVMLEQEKGNFKPDMSGRDEQGFLPQTDPEHEFDGTKGPGKIANLEPQPQ